MQTKLTATLLNTTMGQEADRILRSCVHCGFCTATCPTYQILGDERDGPRGRIYLIKQVLEGKPATRLTQLHLDRCLTCRSCETTCPSGVEYGTLLQTGRNLVEAQVSRPLQQQIMRWAFIHVLPKPGYLIPFVKLAIKFKTLLPKSITASLPNNTDDMHWPDVEHARQVIIPVGCVQSILSPEIDNSTAYVLNQLGISVSRVGGCCGAIQHHLSAEEKAKQQARSNIDLWWPLLEAGAEAILSTASGCGVMLKEYAHLLKDDPDYREKAKKVTALTKDLVELLEVEDIEKLQALAKKYKGQNVSFHSPCTLQHGQQLNGRVERILNNMKIQTNTITDSHLCCGSAGTYSLTQPVLSRKLRDNKIKNLTKNKPELIATANIGCLLHLAKSSPVPVVHWIQLLDNRLS
jgi:glycolate oxidase iron-sulfur subunit